MAIGSLVLNEPVYHYKKPHSQSHLALQLLWFYISRNLIVHVSSYEKIVLSVVESTEGNRPLQLLTEPYVNLSIHTALVIQPPNSILANEQTMSDIVGIAHATIDWHAIFGAVTI
jgi:hypothetical protein